MGDRGGVMGLDQAVPNTLQHLMFPREKLMAKSKLLILSLD